MTEEEARDLRGRNRSDRRRRAQAQAGRGGDCGARRRHGPAKEERGEIPTSIRFVFYELEQLGLVSKERLPGTTSDNKNLTKAITWLRDKEIIPWDWVKDEFRMIHSWATYPSLRAGILRQLQLLSLDPYQGAVKPFIVTESRATASIIADRIASEYSVPVVATAGMSRGFLETEVKRALDRRSRKYHVLYLGDMDDVGGQIERHTQRIVGAGLTWERLATTAEQIAELQRQNMRPVMKRDKRYKDNNPHEAWECEALGQRAIEDIVTRRLVELLPRPLSETLEEEKRQREHIREHLMML